MLSDDGTLGEEEFMGHVRAAQEAHERARAGEDVDWDQVIREHIVRPPRQDG